MVEEAGPGMALAAGTRVAVFNKLFCGACEQCLLGRQNLCTVEPGQLGFNRDGGDAEYVLAPERNLAVLPDAVDFATAAVLTCAGMTAVHATRMSRLESGQTAVVNGIGGVGILVVQAAANAGATVIAVADADDKAELATKHGAADVIVLAPRRRLRDAARRCQVADRRPRRRRVLRAGRHHRHDDRGDPLRWPPVAGSSAPGTPTSRCPSTRSSSSCPRPAWCPRSRRPGPT